MTEPDVAVDALAEQHAATVSVHVGGLDGATWFERDADLVFPAASTIKVAVVEALHRSGLELRERVPVRSTLPSAARGATYETTRGYDNDDEPWLRLGGLVRLDWLAERSMVRSSNLATNLLLDRLGLQVVDAVYTGLDGCRVGRPIEDRPAAAAGRENTVTARGLSQVLTGVSGETEALMARCEDVGMSRAVPRGTAYAHKPGWFDGVCHDHGIVRPPDAAPFVISVLTTADLGAEEHRVLLTEVARAVWPAAGAGPGAAS